MLGQRKETTELIVTWQKQTDTLMANCVSHDVTKTMLDNMQKITETMLGSAQKDLERMQKAIDAERARTDRLMDQATPRPREQRSRVFRNVDGYIRQMYIGLRH